MDVIYWGGQARFFLYATRQWHIKRYQKSLNMHDLYINFILIMRTNSNQDEGKFILPTGVATSGSQLKSLQQKLLQNYYESHTQLNQYPYASSKGLSSEAKSTKKSEIFNPNINEKEKYLNQYDLQSKLAVEKQKNGLTSDLIAQMDYKNLKKQYQRHQSLQEQAKLISNTSKFDSLEKQRIKQFNNKYRMEAQQDRQIKEQKKIMELNLQQHEKQFYRNRYNIGGLPRSQSMGSLQRPVIYSNPTKQYYYEIENAMRTRDRSNPNNPQSFRRNSSFKITQNDDRAQRVDNMYSSSLKQHYAHHTNMLQAFKTKQLREKEDLKQVLLNQIRQRQQMNKQQRRNHLEIPYASKDFRQVHHPINNPVDFRFAHDNKYVIGELKSVK